MKRHLYPKCVLIFIFLVFSCSRSRTDFSHNEHTIQIQPVRADADDMTAFYAERSFPEPVRRIAVLFGYGYNDSVFASSVIDKLKSAFGLVQDGGSVLPLVFPDDFKRGGTARISSLSSMLDANGIDGLILLGAPEGTHSVLARMQDAAGGIIGYPVFSLLPQDDLLGMEAGCDLVLECIPFLTDDITAAEESAVFISENIPELLMRAVRYMSLLPQSVLCLDSDLQAHAQQLTGSRWTVSRYIDPETGLRPVNHFVIEQL